MNQFFSLIKRRFAPEHRWPTMIVAFMTVFIAVNVAFVSTAFRNGPQLVSETYYADGFNLRRLAERKAASEAIGWKISVHYQPAGKIDWPLIQLDVKEPNGAPCDSLSGTIGFYRPSDKLLDLPAIPIHPMGAGKYFAKLPHSLEHGAWRADVQVSRGRQEVEQRVAFFVD